MIVFDHLSSLSLLVKSDEVSVLRTSFCAVSDVKLFPRSSVSNSVALIAETQTKMYFTYKILKHFKSVLRKSPFYDKLTLS